MWTPKRLCAAAAPAVVLVALGCASTPKPVADITEAHTLVQQAEQSDAQQFASSDLEAARSKLRQADADSANQPVVAMRLAQESSADAQLALARTRAAKANQALQEVDSGNTTLRNESERQGGGTAVIVTPAIVVPVGPPPPPPSATPSGL